MRNDVNVCLSTSGDSPFTNSGEVRWSPKLSLGFRFAIDRMSDVNLEGKEKEQERRGDKNLARERERA